MNEIEYKIEPGRMKHLTGPAPTKKYQWWAGAGVDIQPVTDHSAVAVAAKSGSYTVLCWTANNDSPLPATEFKLIVGGGKNPWKFPSISLPSMSLPSWLKTGGAEVARYVGTALVVFALMTVAGKMEGCKIPWPVPPGPAPTPIPVPPEPVPPSPAAIEIDGFAVLIVEESADRSKLTPGQRAVLFGKAARDYLEEKCVADPYVKNTKAYRILDKDTAMTQAGAAWEKAMKRDRKSVPWIVISNPKTGGFEGPLPEKEEDAMAILKKFGG